MSTDARARFSRAFGLAAALLVGLNLRPAITSISALLEQTAAWFGLEASQVSLLATLPVIAFGVTAPVGPFLARRLGVNRTLAWAMVTLMIALIARALIPGAVLPATFVVGTAIMAAGTLLPQYLKSLSAGGLWIGLSSMSFSAGAALGAGLTVPLSTVSGLPPAALAVWAVPAAVAAAAMAIVSLAVRQPPPQPRRVLVRRDALPSVALVTAVFGLQAMLFFAVASWLPKLLADRGADAAHAGMLLAWVSVAGLVPTLVTPVLARRRRIIVWLGPGLGLGMVVAFLWLASGDDSFLGIATLLGVVQSAAFGLALSLIVTQSADEGSAGVLSAVAQGAGYAFAGAGSFAIGNLHEATGGWTWSLMILAAIAAVLIVVTALAIRCRPVSLLVPSEPGLPWSSSSRATEHAGSR